VTVTTDGRTVEVEAQSEASQPSQPSQATR
jgi:hypothetical protein